MKKGLIISVVLLPIILVLLFNIHVNNHSQDIPPIDDSDLLVVRPVIPATNNAYHVFTNAVQALCLSEKNEEQLKDYLWELEPEEGIERLSQEQIASIIESNKLFFSFMREGTQLDHCVIEHPQESVLSMLDLLKMNVIQLTEIKLLIETGKVNEALDAAMISLRFGEFLERDSQDILIALVGFTVISRTIYFIDKIVDREVIAPDRAEKVLKQLQRIKRLRTGLETGYKAFYSFLVADGIGQMEAIRYKGLAPHGVTRLIRTDYLFKPNATKKVLAEYWRDQIDRLKYPEKKNRIPLDMSEYRPPVGRLQTIRFALGENSIGKALLMMSSIAEESIVRETESAHKTEEEVLALEKKLLSRQLVNE